MPIYDLNKFCCCDRGPTGRPTKYSRHHSEVVPSRHLTEKPNVVVGVECDIYASLRITEVNNDTTSLTGDGEWINNNAYLYLLESIVWGEELPICAYNSADVLKSI